MMKRRTTIQDFPPLIVERKEKFHVCDFVAMVDGSLYWELLLEKWLGTRSGIVKTLEYWVALSARQLSYMFELVVRNQTWTGMLPKR